MYLNLDLLYNIDKYIYPLFYYKFKYGYDLTEIYSPMTKKSVYKNIQDIIYSDFITKKYKGSSLLGIFDDTHYIFTENLLNYDGFIYNKCKPFKLSKKDLHFLKSNTRIN